MAYRCRETEQRMGSHRYRAVEVVLVQQGRRPADDRVAALTVANDWETLCFVREHMDEITANMAGVMRMKAENSQHIEETAKLFEANLEPFFTLISAVATDHVLDKLSVSLRKALLLMAMDRYSCDNDSICRALGITRVKLEKELKRCGLLQKEQKAA